MLRFTRMFEVERRVFKPMGAGETHVLHLSPPPCAGPAQAVGGSLTIRLPADDKSGIRAGQRFRVTIEKTEGEQDG